VAVCHEQADSGRASSASTATTSGSRPQHSQGRPSSLEEWEALWAQERQAIVQRIEDNGWGKSADGRTLTGPEGFTIDLTKCPAGWSDTEGLTDTEMRIGQTTALSGVYADYGYRARAIGAMLDYYSTQGAFKDSTGKTRKADYIIKDDGVDPARTVPLTDELIDSEKVFAQMTLGSANGFAVYGKLNARCIPHPFEQSGHPAWGDPVNHPWTTGLQLAYNTESVMWGAFIDQHLAEFPEGKVTIAALYLNNDYGKVAIDSLRAYLEQSPNAARYNVVTETVEREAPVVTDPMTTLASKNPQVFVGMLGGIQCTAAINEAEQNGMHQRAKYLFLPNLCIASSLVGKDAVGGDGSASNGWWIVNGGIRDINSPAELNDPYIAWARGVLKDRGIDPASSGSLNTGLGDAFAVVQSLRLAGELPGGLTRSNFILAQRSLDMTDPMLVEGMRFNMNGNKDAYLLEGGVFQTWDAQKQVWVSQGDPIDLSGKSSPCAWDASRGVCAK
jgi:branched-chain amino acid transport system substrate-binding protein